ncbi:zeta toxin family protein [Kribbella sp. NPDC059898]|uniref:zeta toxin family protein n=1 Tax=Kribbella sp. NPDC059898 TaxID=3346995 RepID=UPI00366A2FB3
MNDLTLSRAEADAVTARRLEEITPAAAPSRAPGVRPLAVLIGAQPGAGKSTTQRAVRRALGDDTTASYDFDDNAAAHPRYSKILSKGRIDAHRDVHESLPPELHRRCLDHLTKGETQYDVVASAPLSWEQGAKPWVDGFADEGYRVAVVYVATNDANSLLSVADRYQQSVDDHGIGRWVEPRLHDQAYRGAPDAAHALEAQAYVDEIYVVDRDGNVLYENHRLPDGTMEREPGARQAMLDERDRPPTPAEMDQFRQTARGLLRHDPEVADPVRDVVSDAMMRQAARATPADHGRSPAPESRIDARIAIAHRVASSGLAPPHGITAPPPTTSARPTSHPRPDHTRDR